MQIDAAVGYKAVGAGNDDDEDDDDNEWGRMIKFNQTLIQIVFVPF